MNSKIERFIQLRDNKLAKEMEGARRDMNDCSARFESTKSPVDFARSIRAAIDFGTFLGERSTLKTIKKLGIKIEDRHRKYSDAGKSGNESQKWWREPAKAKWIALAKKYPSKKRRAEEVYKYLTTVANDRGVPTPEWIKRVAGEEGWGTRA